MDYVTRPRAVVIVARARGELVPYWFNCPYMLGACLLQLLSPDHAPLLGGDFRDDALIFVTFL